MICRGLDSFEVKYALERLIDSGTGRGVEEMFDFHSRSLLCFFYSFTLFPCIYLVRWLLYTFEVSFLFCLIFRLLFEFSVFCQFDFSIYLCVLWCINFSVNFSCQFYFSIFKFINFRVFFFMFSISNSMFSISN